MPAILLFLSDKTPVPNWADSLPNKFEVSLVKDIPINNKDIVILDTHNLEIYNKLFMPFNQLSFRCLIVGNQWPDDEQVAALINGAGGYCEVDESKKIIQQALSSIMKGEIWIQKHLVQRVIGSLIKLNAQKQERKSVKNTAALNLLNKLSARELEVAKMVETGENNKKIAQYLNISERTVKAHLTSTFKKLNVKDRLHLALLMKEISV